MCQISHRKCVFFGVAFLLATFVPHVFFLPPQEPKALETSAPGSRPADPLR